MDTPIVPGVDPLQQLLLAQLAGDPIPVGPSVDDLLAQGPEDPMTAAVLDALRRRREREAVAEKTASSSVATDFPTAEDEPADDTEPDAGVADVLRRLYDEVSALRARTEALADALGACATCWGWDPNCPTCRGRGVPGGRVPVERAFAEYVRPALERRKAHREGQSAAPARPRSLDEIPSREPVSLI